MPFIAVGMLEEKRKVGSKQCSVSSMFGFKCLLGHLGSCSNRSLDTVLGLKERLVLKMVTFGSNYQRILCTQP